MRAEAGAPAGGGGGQAEGACEHEGPAGEGPRWVPSARRGSRKSPPESVCHLQACYRERGARPHAREPPGLVLPLGLGSCLSPS